MKKIVILTALFSGILVVSYAQQTNITTTPVYDNDRNEHLIKHVITPKEMEKYSLIDNSPAQNRPLVTERILLTSGKKNDNPLFKIDASDYSNDLKQYDIKKVNFPKVNSLIRQ